MITLDKYTPRHARTQYDALAETYPDSMRARVCLGLHCAGRVGPRPHRHDRVPVHLSPVVTRKVLR